MKQSFYGKIRSRGYDIGTEQDEIINYYLGRWTQLRKPVPVLEPMCGTGLNLIPFLGAGADADGLDSSSHILEVFREKCEVKGWKPGLFEQYIEEMELPRKYGFIFIPGGSFGHIYDNEIAMQALRNIADHLLDGGWLVLDIRPPSHLNNFGKPGESNLEVTDYPDGSVIFATSVWGDIEEERIGRCWNKYEKYVDNQLVETEVFDYRERMYTRDEFESLLIKAGFRTIHVTAAYEDSKDVKEDDGMVFTCQK
jgi:SAM-dependent methyltransferase